MSIAPLRSFADEDSKFLKRAQKLLELSSSLDKNQGVSVGLSGSAFVAGTGIAADAINFDGKVSFFCSSSLAIKAETGLGVTADFNKVSTRGCDNAGKYEGLFATFASSSGFAMLGKGTVGSAISYGFNHADFFSNLGQNFVADPKNFRRLLSEIKTFALCLQSDASSKLFRVYLQTILRNLQNLVNRIIVNTSLRNDLSVQIENILNILDHSVDRSACEFDSISEKLEKNSKKFLEFSQETAKDNQIAALLPSKEKLALLVEASLDSKYFPFLRGLLQDFTRGSMSGCDAVTTGLSVGLGGSPAADLSVGFSVSNFKKIGPTLDEQEVKESMIYRDLLGTDFKVLKNDSKETFARVCTVAGHCVWKAACMMTDREAFISGINKAYSVCSKSAKNTVDFLNGMYECFKGNYKELTVTAYETLNNKNLSKVGK